MISDRFESKSLKVRTSKVLTDSNSIRGEGGEQCCTGVGGVPSQQIKIGYLKLRDDNKSSKNKSFLEI